MAVVFNTRRGRLRLAYGVALVPGRNVVDDAVWEKCLAHPVTDHYVQRRDIMVPSVVEARERATPDGNDEDWPLHEPAPTTDASPYGDPESPPLAFPTVAAERLDCLDSLKAKEAIAYVQGIGDVDELKRLKTVEARSTVIKAVDRILEDLEG